MKISLFCVSVLVSGAIFCSDDKYGELPPVFNKICKNAGSWSTGESLSEECRYLYNVMSSSNIKKASEARDIVKGISCYDATLTAEEIEASKFLKTAEKRAEGAVASIKKLGQEYGLPEKTISEATTYCQAKIQGKMMQSKAEQVSESVPTKPAECFGCAMENQSSWWPWAQKKQ